MAILPSMENPPYNRFMDLPHETDANHLGRSRKYIEKVQQFCELVLEDGRDKYGEYSTPLFVDGLDVDTHEPVRWRVRNEKWTLSNFGNQQILLRTLVGLSQLTDNPRYLHAAEEATDYVFAHLRHGKLISMGGHMAYDLERKRPVFAPDKGPVHELKCHYPFYDLMWSVNSSETQDYIDAIWEGHILDWGRLEFSRHGTPSPASEGHRIWKQSYVGGDVFFVGRGLTFINAGSDLIYAGASLSRLSGDPRPLTWAKRLADRYVQSRNPTTGLCGYQFSLSVLPGKNGRGDRAIAQFGEQLREHHPHEGNLCVTRQIRTILGKSSINRMLLSEQVGEQAKPLLEAAVGDLLAYSEYAYDAEQNLLHPVLTDGHRLTGLVIEKSGYYGMQGDVLKAAKADFSILWSYVLGYRLSREKRLWETARWIAKGLKVGDIGELPGNPPALNLNETPNDSIALFAMIELYKTTQAIEFLNYAEHIGDEIVLRSFHKGMYLYGQEFRYAKLDALEPLALLHLTAHLRGTPDAIPLYWGSSAFFGSEYEDQGHQIDNAVIYGQRNAKLH